MSIELIRRFEPILYFHKNETFFPSDAKRYLEECALWKADKPFADKSSWKAMIAPGKIAAAEDETAQPGEADDTYLGKQDDTGFPFLDSGSLKERYINPSGWANTSGEVETEVTPTSENRFAALERLAGFYSSEPPGGGPELNDSRFWYHAEAFDSELLTRLTKEHPIEIDLPKFLGDPNRFKNPFILCYYLFFPGHLEHLQGCETIESGPNFGSFAGEWACVAILLDRENSEREYEAKYLGLASRNSNKDGEPMPAGRVVDRDGRVGMVIYDWVNVPVFASAPDHAQLYVSNGAHSLYVAPGQKDLYPLSPRDPTIINCGSAEPLPHPSGHVNSSEEVALVLLAKLALGGLVGLATGGAGFGLLAGILWDALELALNPSVFVAAPPEPDDPQQDFPPEEGDFGIIVHPPGFVPPDAGPSNHVSWPVEHTITSGGRTYTTIVDRLNPTEAGRQVWLPGWDHKGYEGRWGPRVSPDPLGRRSGMHFPRPEFLHMFLIALTKHLSK